MRAVMTILRRVQLGNGWSAALLSPPADKMPHATRISPIGPRGGGCRAATAAPAQSGRTTGRARTCLRCAALCGATRRSATNSTIHSRRNRIPGEMRRNASAPSRDGLAGLAIDSSKPATATQTELRPQSSSCLSPANSSLTLRVCPAIQPAFFRSVGVVAQLVEHHNGIVGVRGSNPLGSTILSDAWITGEDGGKWVKMPKPTKVPASNHRTLVPTGTLRDTELNIAQAGTMRNGDTKAAPGSVAQCRRRTSGSPARRNAPDGRAKIMGARMKPFSTLNSPDRASCLRARPGRSASLNECGQMGGARLPASLSGEMHAG